MSNNSANIKSRHQPVIFCGVEALSRRLKILSSRTEEQTTRDEISSVMFELHLLGMSLHRLRYERSFVDDQDIDLTIDRLLSIDQEGA